MVRISTLAVALLFGWLPLSRAFLSLKNWHCLEGAQVAGNSKIFETASILSLYGSDDGEGGKILAKREPQPGNDSIKCFSRDLKYVLHRLRRSDDDLEVPAVLRERKLSMTNMWNLDDWKQHSTRTRFLHYVRSFPTSRLLRRVWPQFSVFVVWTVLSIFVSPRGWVIEQAVVPLTPLSLVSTFVAALLTMRSNTGLSRLSEGREAWGRVVFRTRDLGQLIATKVYPRDPQVALLMARHTSLFGWVLKANLRGTEKDVIDIVRTMLPPVDAEYVLSQRKLPVPILAKLRQVCQQLAAQGQLTIPEEMSLDRSIEELDHVLMTCQRICASPIPPLYTSHTSRLLMFYLAFLPLALYQSSLNGFVTFIICFVVGYTMFGLDEISHLLEQPFCLMPLLQLSKASMLDIGDSMVCQPASLEKSLYPLGGAANSSMEDTTVHTATVPEYW